MRQEATPPAPAGLSAKAQSLWRAVVAKCGTIGRQAMLEQSLFALDRCEVCRQAVNNAGMTATTPRSGALHLHPLLRSEEQFRRQFMAGWQALGLDSAGGGIEWPPLEETP